MKASHARFILLTSLVLLFFVVLDFSSLKISKDQNNTPTTETNLSEAISQIGKALNSSSTRVLGEETATDSASPVITIDEPQENFEALQKEVIIKGSISDYAASISAKLNDRFLGNVKVSTEANKFEKAIKLEEGKNTIVLTAVATNGAKAVASVSGVLLAGVNSLSIFAYIILFVLALVAAYGVIYSLKKLRSPKKNSEDKK